MNKMISVGMTTYNSHKWVEQQLVSILNQTIKPDEIVICDDASTDTTVEIINRIKETSSTDIKIFVNDENVGFVKNFEHCFALCSGDIIISCDADDIWFPDKIQTIKEEFEKEDVVYVYHDAVVIDNEEKVILNSLNKTWDYLSNGGTAEEILLRNLHKEGFPYGMTIAFRRELFEKIRPFYLGHDEWINLCAPLFGKVTKIDRSLSYYRRHNNNASNSNIVKQNNKFKTIVTNIRRTEKEKWFGWPSLQLQAYELYFSRFENILSKKIIIELTELIRVKKGLENIVYSSKMKGIKLLVDLYKEGLYVKYRGTRNMLILDCLYIFLKG